MGVAEQPRRLLEALRAPEMPSRRLPSSRRQRRISQSQPKLDASSSSTTLTGSALRSWAWRRTRCLRFASQRRTASIASPSIAASATRAHRFIRTSAVAICSTSDSSATLSGLICAAHSALAASKAAVSCSGTTTTAAMPCFQPLRRLFSLPSMDFGPLDLLAFRRLASILRSEEAAIGAAPGAGSLEIRRTIGRRRALVGRTRAVVYRIVPHAVGSHKTFAEPALGPSRH